MTTKVVLGGVARAEFERLFVEHHQKFPDCDCQVCTKYFVRDIRRRWDTQRAWP